MQREIIIDKENSTSMRVCNEKVEFLRSRELTKVGARIFNNGKIFSSSYVGEIEDEAILKSAMCNDELATSYNHEIVKPVVVHESHVSTNFNKEEFLRGFHHVSQELCQTFPQFIFNGRAEHNYTSRHLKHFDHDISQYIESSHYNWTFQYRHKDSKGLCDGSFSFKQKDKLSHEEEINSYSEFLDCFSNVMKLQSKKYPIVFMQPDMNHLVRKVYESASILSYRQEVGVFKGQLGAEILSPKFSMYDVSFDPERMIFSPFDGEGFVRENPKLPIVENGVFKNLYSDCRFGHKYGMLSTGNGQREFNSEVRLSPNTAIVKKGKRSYKEILADLPECIAIEVSAGDNFSESGEYSAPVQNAYFYKNGKLQGRCPQLTVVTHIKKMFGEDLIEIASDSFISKKDNPAIFMEADVMIYS